ncbi:hypothetical protein EC988_006312 [Linderina pennispora]|nr:hypothetical protein EC988_006312 [Linderina pennispora]
MAMGADSSVAGSPVDWAMFAGISAPSTTTPVAAPEALAHVSGPSAGSGASGAIGPHVDGHGNQGFLALYDEMLRDPTSLMSVLGQDLAGWQCPSKTSTIDPAALCAVDPEATTL